MLDTGCLAASADEAGAPGTIPHLPPGLDGPTLAKACSLILDWEMGDIPDESELAIALFELFRAAGA
jgi:hypothetical protein